MADKNQIIKQAKEALDRAIIELRQKKNFIDSIGKDISAMLAPFVEAIKQDADLNRQEFKDNVESIIKEISKESKLNKDELKSILSQLKFENKIPDIQVPPVDTSGIESTITKALAKFKFPEPKVNVNVPEMSMPDIIWPKGSMPITGSIRLADIDLSHPLPVQIRDSKGNPIDLSKLGGVMVSGGSGGFKDVNATIVGANVSIAANIVDSTGIAYSGSNPLPITGSLTLTLPSGPGDEATATRILQAGDSVSSVNVLQVASNPVVVGTGYQDNALRVVHATDAIVSVNVVGANVSVAASIVDSSGIGYSGSNPLPISWVSGAGATVGAANIDSSGVQYSGSNPFPIKIVTDATATVNTALTDSGGVQYSGSNPLPINLVSQSLASSASVLVDSTGVAYEGANPLPITIANSSNSSVNASLIDSGGVGYSGSNPVPITIVSGALTSIIAVGDTLHDAVDIGAAPVKVGGVSMQTNPTAVGDGDRVNFRADDIGRQLTRPVQVRDLMATAYVSLSTGTEATLLAGASGVFNDLVYVMMANNSSVAVIVDIRDGTAAGVVLSVSVPANGTAGVSLPVPIPQTATANAWTVDMPDITGTIVYISALFSKEV